ncbi:MAG: hypothetical protein COW08_03915 [Ignavibacteriales bacterium CG12_big_fil_rev_8_21_14_0_65_30_8]|nr:MAG: hypothetical protein COW08_03915 [Ignavibacteriales bacterium CG12_big_fil_rev_8_21_14_0_65_30_8]
MKLFIKTFILFFFNSIFLFSFTGTDSTSADFYKAGLDFVKSGNLVKGEYYFKKSLDINKTSKAEFELAKIYISEKTISGRAKARILLTNAIYREPKNIEIRLLKAALMESFSTGMAFKEYEEILEIDTINVIALFQLGRFKENEFNDYHRSVFKDDPFSPELSYEEFALEDFEESEKYFLTLLKYYPENSQALLHLGILYEDLGKPEKGIPLLEKLTELEPKKYLPHLYLGLLFYKNSQNSRAYNEYKKALEFMSPKEREDFTFNSVKELIKPIFKDEIKDFTEKEFRQLIDEYWKIMEPLYLTKYNERILEHYSRVAYANLRFSLPKENLTGWKTDRGDTYLRYGEPINRVRFRPHINAGGRTQVNLKTDVWYYTDMVFGFTDDFMNGNFRFSTPTPGSRYVSQFAGDSYRFANYVKNVRNEIYNPKFDGPKFKIPYDIVQFKDLNNPEKTDVYISYGLAANDTLIKNGNYIYPHIAGFFYSDLYYNLKNSVVDTVSNFRKSGLVNIEKDSSLLVNSLALKLPPDSGYLALEVLRNIDKGVAANRDKITVKRFGNENLEISDIVLALDISTKNENYYTLKRRNFNILPNPYSIFSDVNKINIYYEVYNLNLNESGIANFEQKLTIKKIEEKSSINKFFGSILKVFGKDEDDNSITLSTNYRTLNKNQSINFMLDMSSYDSGDYLLTIKITDSNNKSISTNNKNFKWINNNLIEND